MTGLKQIFFAQEQPGAPRSTNAFTTAVPDDRGTAPEVQVGMINISAAASTMSGTPFRRAIAASASVLIGPVSPGPAKTYTIRLHSLNADSYSAWSRTVTVLTHSMPRAWS
jgi:hypothetical protein